ncbi:MAG: TSUP family transporter [Candidatus Cloacimonetes bacterium]|nr:TSUP family transporter [Candidatus Cloacimonadota bacterium]
MPEITLTSYLIILPAIFFAGLVDAIAGGGGLISVPAYLAAGLPPHFVLGNNKFSSTFGTMLTTARYLKHGFIDLKVALASAFCALIGSHIGTKTVLLLNPDFLNYILLILIPAVTAITLLKKDLGKYNNSHEIKKITKIFLAVVTGLVIGFYDGFFGPGTGTFLIIIFALILKYDLVRANGNTKVVNLASNISAMITFVIHGKVIYMIAIPAVICGIVGNLIGSKMVVKKGSNIIKPLMIIVLCILFIKIVTDLF